MESRSMKLTVTGLGTLLDTVSILIAIAALEIGHVTRLSALLRHVTLLTTVATTTGTGLRAVLGEVSHCHYCQHELLIPRMGSTYSHCTCGTRLPQQIEAQYLAQPVSTRIPRNLDGPYNRQLGGQAVHSSCRRTCRHEEWGLGISALKSQTCWDEATHSHERGDPPGRNYST